MRSVAAPALSGTLHVDRADHVQGESIVFDYTTDRPSKTNWVGLFPGTVDTPARGGYTTYEYADGTSGSVDIASGRVRPGDYTAFFLANDGYEMLADPVRLKITGVPTRPAPVFLHSIGKPGHLPGRFDRPTGIAVDHRGTMYVADTGNNRVQVFARNGRWLRVLGLGTLREPEAVAIAPDGSIVVADTGNDRLVRFAWWGAVQSIISDVQSPRGVSVDAKGVIHASDQIRQRVLSFDRDGKKIGELSAEMSAPQGVLADGADLFVVQNGWRDSGRCAVVRYVDGAVRQKYGYGQQTWYGGLSDPAHCARGADGSVYVSVPGIAMVLRFGATGPFLGEFGAEQLRFPMGIALGDKGRIFVADSGNHRIAVFGGVR